MSSLRSVQLHLCNQRGLTLMEGIFAVTLISFGMMGFLWFFQQLNQVSVNSEMSLVASRLASERVEQVLADRAVNGYDSVIVGESEEVVNYNNMDYLRTTLTNFVDANDLQTITVNDTGFKRVVVSVDWNAGDPQQIQMVSVLSDY